MSDQKHVDTTSDWGPEIKDLKSFTIAPLPNKSDTGEPADQGYCLWGDNGQEHRPVGSTVCITGSVFKCAADGTWINQNQPCPQIGTALKL